MARSAQRKRSGTSSTEGSTAKRARRGSSSSGSRRKASSSKSPKPAPRSPLDPEPDTELEPAAKADPKPAEPTARKARPEPAPTKASSPLDSPVDPVAAARLVEGARLERIKLGDVVAYHWETDEPPFPAMVVRVYGLEVADLYVLGPDRFAGFRGRVARNTATDRAPYFEVHGGA